VNNVGQQAQELIDSNAHDEAIELLTNSLIVYPNHLKLYQLLGRVLEGRSDESDVESCFAGFLSQRIQEQYFMFDKVEFSPIEDGLFTLQHLHDRETTPCKSKCLAECSHLHRFQGKMMTSARASLLSVESGSVWFDGHNTVAFDKHNRVIEESVVGNIAPVVLATKNVKPVNFTKKVVLLASRGSNNYFHWLFDILPKIKLLEDAGIDYLNNTVFVVYSFTQKFQIETLQLLGIKRKNIHETMSSGCLVTSNEVFVPILNNVMGLRAGKWLTDWLFTRFTALSESNSESKVEDKANRKLLISRDPETSHGRHIENLEEFNNYFIERGYDLVIPDRLEFLDQVKLFSQAVSVVGPHGAGLANILFCRSSTRILELYGAHFAPCYWAISEIKGLEYSNVACNALGYKGTEVAQLSRLEKFRTLDSRRSSGFVVDMQSVARLASNI
jgi:hypothetical protein